MKPLFFLFSLVALASAEAASGGLEEAVGLFRMAKLEEARTAASALEDGDPDYARAQYLLGEICLLQEDPVAAESAFRAADGKRGDSAPILVGLGRSLLLLDRADEAEKALAKAVAADPADPRALAWLGVARLRASEGRRGGAELRKALQSGSNDPEVARIAVVERIREEDLSAAAAAAEAFASRNPKAAMGPFLRALVLERRRKYDDAIEQYRKAIALEEGFLDAHKNLAILCIAENPLYRNAERTALAMKHFARYEDLGGRDVRVKEIHQTLLQFLQPNGK